MKFITILLYSEWDDNKLNSNEMEDQIDTVLHWSYQKEPKQAKNKDEVIRRNLDRIRISAATPRPPNPSRHSQVILIQKNNQNFFFKEPRSKN